MTVRIIYVKGRACVQLRQHGEGFTYTATFPIPCGQGRNIRRAVKAQAWDTLAAILRG